jgi:UDP-N-acetylmuramate--alanine ligase
VFQPHTYTRTLKLMDRLAGSFGAADEVVVADIYAAREPDTGEVHASQLAHRLSAAGVSARYLPDFDDIAAYLAARVREGDRVVTMGAGTIEQVGHKLLALL